VLDTMTTSEAGERLGIKSRSIVALIRLGLMTATKRGRDYAIARAEVERYAVERRPAHRAAKPRGA